MSPADPVRDRATVRRALAAGAVVWLAAALGLGVSSALSRTLSGEAALLVAALGLVVGGLAATCWLVLAAWLDLRAGEPPGLRRWLWTAAVLVIAVLAVPLAAATIAG